LLAHRGLGEEEETLQAATQEKSHEKVPKTERKARIGENMRKLKKKAWGKAILREAVSPNRRSELRKRFQKQKLMKRSQRLEESWRK